MPAPITVTLTAPEAQVLLQLLDAAVKARGMEAAEAGLLIHNKVVNALRVAAKADADAGSVPTIGA